MDYLLSALIGLIFGSFANVCIYRLPRDQSIVAPGSHCPDCQSPIRWKDNIPIISYIVLRGHCRNCYKPISTRYLAIELILGLLFFLADWRYRPSWHSIVGLDILTFEFFTLSVIDAIYKIIPDELSLSLLVIGIIFAPWNTLYKPFALHNILLDSVLTAFAAGICMLFLAWVGEKWFKKEALGGGDVKLIAGIGAFLGWQAVVGALFLGSCLGALFAISQILTRHKKFYETIPFGPFLSLGAYLTCIIPIPWNRFLFP